MLLGFIGLGRMGWPMAHHIYENVQNRKIFLGSEIVDTMIVYDVDKNVQKAFAEKHPKCIVAENLRELSRKASTIWLMIPSKYVYETVTREISPFMSKGFIIDGGNSDPRVSIKLYNSLKERNIKFIDVGCSGGPPKAREADLALMVGGDLQDYRMIESLLKILGNPIYVGPSGCGHLVKMLHNVLEYIIMGGIGEIYALLNILPQKLMRKNINIKNALKAMNSGLAGSRLLQLTIEILESNIDISKVVPYVSGGTQAVWTLEMAKDIPTIFTDLALLQRKVSRNEDYSKELDKLMRDIEKLETLRENPDGRFEIQSLLRGKFGGHKVYYKPE